MSAPLTIASFWVGPYLSWIEQVAMKTFIAAGHKYILYTQGEVLNVPEGVEVRPSNEIWQDDRITGYKYEKKLVQHPATLRGDFFRWHLQAKTDYLYVDADVICLRPLAAITHQGLYDYAGCVMRYPSHSPIIPWVLKFLSTPYPVPPWFSRKERWRLWRQKLKGKPVHIGEMPWGTALLDLRSWAAGECKILWKETRNLVLTRDAVKTAFLPKEAFEKLFYQNSETPYMLIFSWPIIHGWQPDYLTTPPPDSWIAQKAKELGVDIAAAPVLETRAKNREYLAKITGDKDFIL